jgi:hypothetical protein
VVARTKATFGKAISGTIIISSIVIVITNDDFNIVNVIDIPKQK